MSIGRPSSRAYGSTTSRSARDEPVRATSRSHARAPAAASYVLRDELLDRMIQVHDLLVREAVVAAE